LTDCCHDLGQFLYLGFSSIDVFGEPIELFICLFPPAFLLFMSFLHTGGVESGRQRGDVGCFSSARLVFSLLLVR